MGEMTKDPNARQQASGSKGRRADKDLSDAEISKLADKMAQSFSEGPVMMNFADVVHGRVIQVANSRIRSSR